MNASLERRGAGNGMSATQATGWLRDHSSRIMNAGIILALLYLGRSVLIPLALAAMLSLLVAPLIRALRRIRVGRASSVLVAVAALTVLCVGLALALGTQVLRIAESLPQYESNVQRKLETLEEVIVGPILKLTNETSRLAETRESAEATLHAGGVERPLQAVGSGAVLPGPPKFGRNPLRISVAPDVRMRRSAYTDAKYLESSCAGSSDFNGTNCVSSGGLLAKPVVSEGNHLLGSPWNIHLAGEYHHQLIAHGGTAAYARIDYQVLTAQNSQLQTQDSRNAFFDNTLPGLPLSRELGARVGVRFNGFDISLYGANLTDEHPQMFLSRDIPPVLPPGQNPPDNLYYARSVRPRTVGVTGTYRF